MIIESIKRELSHDIDRHSKELLCDNIGMLLDQCLRFYDRQFITREKVNGDVLADFESRLNAYFSEGQARQHGFPTVAGMAGELCFSVGYFGDLIKKETGLTAQQYIQNKIIDLAKQELLGTELSVSDIALNLGFEYPQHFTRMFKKVTGKSPSEFRMIAQNSMKEESKWEYVAPETNCVVVQTESKILTASGDINGMPWEDQL